MKWGEATAREKGENAEKIHSKFFCYQNLLKYKKKTNKYPIRFFFAERSAFSIIVNLFVCSLPVITFNIINFECFPLVLKEHGIHLNVATTTNYEENNFYMCTILLGGANKPYYSVGRL